MSRYPSGSCQQCELKHKKTKENTNVKKIKDTCCVVEPCEDTIDFFIDILKQDTQNNREQQVSVPNNKESLILWKHRKSLCLVDDSTLGIQMGNGQYLSNPKDAEQKTIDKENSF